MPSAAGRGTRPPTKQHTPAPHTAPMPACDGSVPLCYTCMRGPVRTLTALLSAAVTADEEAATSVLIWVLSEASTLFSLVSTLVILPSGEARQRETTKR